MDNTTKTYFVYIMTNLNNTVLYVGVTSNLEKRINQHRKALNKRSFTARYNIYKLVYYEKYKYILNAIQREKQIKGGSRKKKIKLIESINSNWQDLYKERLG